MEDFINKNSERPPFGLKDFIKEFRKKERMCQSYYGFAFLCSIYRKTSRGSNLVSMTMRSPPTHFSFHSTLYLFTPLKFLYFER